MHEFWSETFMSHNLLSLAHFWLPFLEYNIMYVCCTYIFNCISYIIHSRHTLNKDVPLGLILDSIKNAIFGSKWNKPIRRLHLTELSYLTWGTWYMNNFKPKLISRFRSFFPNMIKCNFYSTVHALVFFSFSANG